MHYTRKNPLGIIVIALLALGLLLVVETTKTITPAPFFEDKLAAATLAQKSMLLIKEERLRKGIPINRYEDPNETGIIGAEYTDLTSTLGSISSKRTSTNANFAGVIVEMLHKAGARSGDDVAISLSGSFPALNVAAFAAVKVLKLRPIIISSVGASTYGANHPSLTWLDMETLMRQRGVFSYASEAASLGGIAETGGGLGEQGIVMGLTAIRRNVIPYLDERGPQTLQRDIERRLDIYKAASGGRKPAAFINVGGPLTSLGNCPADPSFPPGLLLKLPTSKCPDRGLILRMNEKGVAVIHLLNIRRIAIRYGLPVDPVPLPDVPSGAVMIRQTYRLPLVLTGIVLLLLALSMEKTLERVLHKFS